MLDPPALVPPTPPSPKQGRADAWTPRADLRQALGRCVEFLPLAPSEWPQDVQKKPQDTTPTIFGCKRAILQKCLFSLRKPRVFEGRVAPLCRPQAATASHLDGRKVKLSLGNTPPHLKGFPGKREGILGKHALGGSWPQISLRRPHLGRADAWSFPPGPVGVAPRRPEEVSRHDPNNLWMQKSGFSKMLVSNWKT